MFGFNLTGVCWTVCGLTYTTCLTVHIHSFHKKYIFLYTAFTLSYNRAVTGTSGFSGGGDLRQRNPLASRHNASWTAFPSRLAPPATRSGRVWVIWPSVFNRFSLSAACRSGLWGGGVGPAAPSPIVREAAGTPRCCACPLLSPSQPPRNHLVTLALFPANVRSTECHRSPPGREREVQTPNQGGVMGEEPRFAACTHLIVGRLVLLALAVVRFAVGQLPQVRIGRGVQLLPDVVVVAAVGEVVRGVTTRAHQVGVGASAQQQLDQREVLLIHRQVQRAAAVPLFLRITPEFRKRGRLPPRRRQKGSLKASGWLTCALMSAPKFTRFSTSERKP